MGSGGKGESHSGLWDTAYQQLKDDDAGKKTLAKLDDTLGKEQSASGKPVGNLESRHGRERLLRLIEEKSRVLDSLKGTSARVAQVCDIMYKAKEIVAASASASPPATVAVAGLFFAFEVRTDSTAAQLLIADGGTATALPYL